MGNYILLALTVFFFVCHLQSIVSQQTSIVQKLKQMENNIGSLKKSTKKEIKKIKTEFNKLTQETDRTIQAGIEECRNTTADLRGNICILCSAFLLFFFFWLFFFFFSRLALLHCPTYCRL